MTTRPIYNTNISCFDDRLNYYYKFPLFLISLPFEHVGRESVCVVPSFRCHTPPPTSDTTGGFTVKYNSSLKKVNCHSCKANTNKMSQLYHYQRHVDRKILSFKSNVEKIYIYQKRRKRMIMINIYL